MYIVNFFKHLKTICIHKYWVGYFCFKAGLYWRGLTHDLSKFNPIEFFESVKYYQGTSSPINAAKKDKGWSKAWQHHKGRNPHHYEYWTDNYDSGTTCIDMPDIDLKELICDYLGACKAYTGVSNEELYVKELEWWNKCKDSKKMSDNTRNRISKVFEILAEHPDKFNDVFHNRIIL